MQLSERTALMRVCFGGLKTCPAFLGLQPEKTAVSIRNR